MGKRTGLILDFDGVIVDSEPAHAAAKRLVLERHGIPFPASLFEDWRGRPDGDFFDHVARDLAPGADAVVLLEAKRGAYRESFDRVALVEGLDAFLPVARAAFPSLGIATSASRDDAALVLDRFGLRAWFDAIVTAEDTTRHKPDPEPYLAAMARLGVRADQAIAVDDSPDGVRSAHGAGLHVVGFARTFSATSLLAAGADRTVADLASLRNGLDSIREG